MGGKASTPIPGAACATCKHFQPIATGAEGSCGRIPFYAETQPGLDSPQIETDFETQGGAWLRVPSGFGCSLHEERCPGCCGLGGDCDAGDDGRSVSWPCSDCGGTGLARKDGTFPALGEEA